MFTLESLILELDANGLICEYIILIKVFVLHDIWQAGEIMKYDYQKKVALLNKQKKRGTSSESLEKTKAAVSHLHTRYIVDMQSMDSTVAEISRLRDEQLYPKLVALVDG